MPALAPLLIADAFHAAYHCLMHTETEGNRYSLAVSNGSIAVLHADKTGSADSDSGTYRAPQGPPFTLAANMPVTCSAMVLRACCAIQEGDTGPRRKRKRTVHWRGGSEELMGDDNAVLDPDDREAAVRCAQRH